MIKKYKRASTQTRRKIKLLKEQGVRFSVARKKFPQINQATFDYWWSPAVRLRQKKRNKEKGSKKYASYTEEQKEHKRQYTQEYRKKRKTWYRKWSNKHNKIYHRRKRAKIIEKNKKLLVQIAKQIGLYETH